MRKLYTVSKDFNNLHYIGVCGTHHVQTHLKENTGHVCVQRKCHHFPQCPSKANHTKSKECLLLSNSLPPRLIQNSQCRPTQTVSPVRPCVLPSVLSTNKTALTDLLSTPSFYSLNFKITATHFKKNVRWLAWKKTVC